MKINVLLVDDDRLITESMKIIFDMDKRLTVAGIANDGESAVKRCLKDDIDVVLMDIRMPNMNGIEATKQIVSQTSAKVLILTTFDEDDYVRECLNSGAKGYLLKTNPPDVIISSVIAVHGGSAVLQEQVMKRMRVKKETNQEKLAGLTSREQDIVKLISEGMTNKEISAKLFISEGTVKNNITAILSKLSLKHRTQIAVYYLKD
jgi:DNA-binding NarL/FixJ family response regulator